jgi:hypothetical protein
MAEKEGFVSMAEATHEVGLAMARLALLHLSFSKTLVEEFGEKRARKSPRPESYFSPEFC